MPDRLPKEVKFVEPVHKEFVRRTGSDDATDHFDLDIREVYFKPSPVVADFSPYYPGGLPPMPNQTGWEVGEWGVGQLPDTKTHFIEIVHPMAWVLMGGVVTAAAVALLLVPALVTMGGRRTDGAPAPSRERVTQEEQQTMPAPGSAS